MQRNKKFKIIFNNDIEIDYRVHNTELAEKWFAKIKHLKRVPFDTIESGTEDVSDLRGIYKEFCNFAGIEYEPFDNINQKICNKLHKLYEDQHEKLSRLPNNTILYKFHHSVHAHEKSDSTSVGFFTGWGVYEGPLTQNFNCGDFYEENIWQNNIYLPWSELGKTPMQYWHDGEPNDQLRFNTLAKPHKTFRAMFLIATQDKVPDALDNSFVEWFDQYKKGWLEHHKINKWDKLNEGSAPLLATTDYKGDLKGCAVNKIII